MNNEMKMEFDAIAENESFARMTVAAFVMSLNPTLEELSDIKTAVSEAVTNAIIHGYGNLHGYEKNKYQYVRRSPSNKYDKICNTCYAYRLIAAAF